jgi:DNA repair protein RadC
MKNEKHTIHELEIKYLPSKINCKPVKITSSDSAFQLLKNVFDPDTIACQEEFIVLYLNRANNVLGTQKLSKGGLSGTIADIRLIYATALKTLSSAIILSHNHPSGHLLPSESDKLLTTKIIKAGEILEISVLDHLILTPNGEYYSFSDNGLM